MEWGELRVLYAQKQREALAVTRSARAVKSTRESRARWPSVGNLLVCLLRGPRHERARAGAAAGGAHEAGSD
jgi:hypothetical protein